MTQVWRNVGLCQHFLSSICFVHRKLSLGCSVIPTKIIVYNNIRISYIKQFAFVPFSRSNCITPFNVRSFVFMNDTCVCVCAYVSVTLSRHILAHATPRPQPLVSAGLLVLLRPEESTAMVGLGLMLIIAPSRALD